MSNETAVIQKESHEIAAQQSHQPETSPMALMQVAVSNGADADQLSKLMDLQERFESRQAEKSFNRAMSKFQSECPRITKSKSGHNYKYAPLGDIQAQIKETAKHCGISWRWETKAQDAEKVTVSCIVTHDDGHSRTTDVTMFIDNGNKAQNKAQAIGAAITYGQRYSLIGALGISTADEDVDARLPGEFQKQAGEKVSDETLAIIDEYLQQQGRSKENLLPWLSGQYGRDIKKLGDLREHEAQRFLSSLKAQGKQQ